MKTQGGYTHIAISREQGGAFNQVRLVGDYNIPAFDQAKAYFKDDDPEAIILVALEDAVQYNATETMTIVWVKEDE